MISRLSITSTEILFVTEALIDVNFVLLVYKRLNCFKLGIYSLNGF